MAENSADCLPEKLTVYYRRLFPYGPFYRWLSYGDVQPNYFQFREFSFTLEDDIYVRFNSYYDRQEMEKDMKKRCPFKIDIGAVYGSSPRDRLSTKSFFAQEREVVFDIDMTDYDDVRTCCSGADICLKCWKFMVVACKILDAALREDFGWKHLLWVFSGRRGIHCWVCDDSARKLDGSSRSAVAEYLQLVQGGEHRAKKINLSGDKLHHSIKRSVNIVEQYFVPMCVQDQDILGTVERMKKVLQLIPDEQLRSEVEKEMTKHDSSLDRWNALVACIESQSKEQVKKRRQYLVEEIMLQYAYPRLDINVTKGLNHLLKSPFCIHPKTGKVCVPFNPRTVEKFNPLTVATIDHLIEEISDYDKEQAAEAEKAGTDTCLRRIKDYRKTSLNKSIVIFEEFVRTLEDTWKGQNTKIEQSDATLDF